MDSASSPSRKEQAWSMACTYLLPWLHSFARPALLLNILQLEIRVMEPKKYHTVQILVGRWEMLLSKPKNLGSSDITNNLAS